MRIIDIKSRRRIVRVSKTVLDIVESAVQGPPAIPPNAYIEHMERTDNPHEVSVTQLTVPEGLPEGYWLKLAVVDGVLRIVATPPPLTEVPELPEYLDEKVKADEGDPEPGFLMAKVAGRLMVDIDRHVLRLAGDTGVYPPNCYYGRNENGVWGFYPIPEQLLPPSGIGLDDDIYAELAEMSGDGFGRSEIF